MSLRNYFAQREIYIYIYTPFIIDATTRRKKKSPILCSVDAREERDRETSRRKHEGALLICEVSGPKGWLRVYGRFLLKIFTICRHGRRVYCGK